MSGRVIDAFKTRTTNEIVVISHKEPACKEKKDGKKVISYRKYAFDLVALN
jgi:hypothetical protein